MPEAQERAEGRRDRGDNALDQRRLGATAGGRCTRPTRPRRRREPRLGSLVALDRPGTTCFIFVELMMDDAGCLSQNVLKDPRTTTAPRSRLAEVGTMNDR